MLVFKKYISYLFIIITQAFDSREAATSTPATSSVWYGSLSSARISSLVSPYIMLSKLNNDTWSYWVGIGCDFVFWSTMSSMAVKRVFNCLKSAQDSLRRWLSCDRPYIFALSSAVASFNVFQLLKLQWDEKACERIYNSTRRREKHQKIVSIGTLMVIPCDFTV